MTSLTILHKGDYRKVVPFYCLYINNIVLNNMNFKKQPLKGVEIHGAPQVGTRTVNILMGEHANEFVRGDIMDANAVL